MTLAYDAHNRLNSATVSSVTTDYAYNGLGERVTKQTGSNTRHYFYGAQQQLLAEYDGTGAVEREYIYLHGQPVVMLDHTGSGIDIYWIHNDHLGRPLSLTNEAGDVVWKLTNADAFGNAASIDEDPDNNSTDLVFNLRFPGQYFDEETGLSYNYHRYYDSAIGRYITSDPIGLLGGVNTYGYVTANPIMAVDIFGLSKCSCVVDSSIAKTHETQPSWWRTRHTIKCRYKCTNTDNSTHYVDGTETQTDYLNMDQGQYGDCKGAIFKDEFYQGDPYGGKSGYFVKRREYYESFDPEGSGINQLEEWEKKVCDKCKK